MTSEETVDERQDLLRADIRRMGAQLGDTIQRNVSVEFFELVEKVRGLARRTRDGDSDARAELESVAASR